MPLVCDMQLACLMVEAGRCLAQHDYLLMYVITQSSREVLFLFVVLLFLVVWADRVCPPGDLGSPLRSVAPLAAPVCPHEVAKGVPRTTYLDGHIDKRSA